jgi:uncharacterized protein YggU (UPF0235/DUF167 family)
MKFLVRVHPGSSREKVVRNEKGSISDVYLTKRPHKGEANKALKKILASELSVAQSRIKIARGEKSKDKLIEIE